MSCLPGHLRLVLALVAVLGNSSCSRVGQTSEEARVKLAFESWKNAMIDYRTDKAMAYIPHHVDDYLNALNSGTPLSPATLAVNPPRNDSPGVDLLLRTALEKKVPADMRAKLTLDALLRRMADRRLLNPRAVGAVDLGRVSIDGNHASAEVYYQGTLTALRLPFLKEGDVWKIDVMAILPYAEVLMRVDRAIKDESETQQVEQIVGKLPSL